MQSLPLYRPSKCLFRVSKYVVAWESLTRLGQGTPPPQEWTSLIEFAADHPELGSHLVAGSPLVLPELRYRYFGDDPRFEKVWPSGESTPATITTMRGGCVVGRDCYVIAPDGKAISDFCRRQDPEALRKSLTGGRWNPKYNRYRRSGDITAWKQLPPAQHFAGSVAPLNYFCPHNYYHFLIDTLPRLAILKRMGIEPDAYIVDPYKPFQSQILTALGIQSKQIIAPHNGLMLQADELVIPSAADALARTETGRLLKDALYRQSVPKKLNAPRLYVSRGKKASRRIRNENDFEGMLQRTGFTKVVMENHDLATQARLFEQANIVVAMHGAGLANLIFAEPGTSVIELMPERRVDFCYSTLSHFMKHRHWVIEAPRTGFRQDVIAPIKEVAQAIAEAEENLQRSSQQLHGLAA